MYATNYCLIISSSARICLRHSSMDFKRRLLTTSELTKVSSSHGSRGNACGGTWSSSARSSTTADFFSFFPLFFFLPIPEHLNFFPVVTVTLYHLPHQIGGQRKLEGDKYFWMRRRFWIQRPAWESREIIHVWEKNNIWRYIIYKLLRKAYFWTFWGKCFSPDTRKM